MAMYAIGTQPLIHRLDGIARQIWYANDSAAGSNLKRLREWWDLFDKNSPLVWLVSKQLQDSHCNQTRTCIQKQLEKSFRVQE